MQTALNPNTFKKLNEDFNKGIEKHPMASVIMCFMCPVAVVLVLGTFTSSVAYIVFSIQSLVVGAQTYRYYAYEMVMNGTNSTNGGGNSTVFLQSPTSNITMAPTSNSTNFTLAPTMSNSYAVLAPGGNCMNVVGVWLIVFGSLGLAGCCLGSLTTNETKPDGKTQSKHNILSIIGSLCSLACSCWLFYGVHLVYTEPWLACNESQYHVFYVLIMVMFWLLIAVICSSCIVILAFAFLAGGMAKEDKEHVQRDIEATQREATARGATGTSAPPATAAAGATTAAPGTGGAIQTV